VAEVGAILRRSTSRTYALVRSRELRSVRVGGSVRVLKADLERYLGDLGVVGPNDR
jgi:excisionase family DNA binding protein